MSNTYYETNSFIEGILKKAIAVGLLLTLGSIIIIAVGILFNPSWLINGILTMFPFFITGLVIIGITGKLLGVVE